MAKSNYTIVLCYQYSLGRSVFLYIRAGELTRVQCTLCIYTSTVLHVLLYIYLSDIILHIRRREKFFRKTSSWFRSEGSFHGRHEFLGSENSFRFSRLFSLEFSSDSEKCIISFEDIWIFEFSVERTKNSSNEKKIRFEKVWNIVMDFPRRKISSGHEKKFP